MGVVDAIFFIGRMPFHLSTTSFTALKEQSKSDNTVTICGLLYRTRVKYIFATDETLLAWLVVPLVIFCLPGEGGYFAVALIIYLFH